MAEAWKRAFADRNHYLADSEFAEMPLDVLVSDAYARARATTIGERATQAPQVQPGVEWFTRGRGIGFAFSGAEEGQHTTHFSIVDHAGTRSPSPPRSTRGSAARSP